MVVLVAVDVGVDDRPVPIKAEPTESGTAKSSMVSGAAGPPLRSGAPAIADWSGHG